MEKSKNTNFMYPLVTMCIPFTRNVTPDWAFSLAAITAPMNATMERVRTVNRKRDLAREKMVDGGLERKTRFIMFLDDDVTVPANILRALLYQFSNLEDDVAVIGGIYCTKTSPAHPLVFKTLGDGPFYKWKLGEVFECDVVATGMMMIRADVFKNLPKPWFKDLEGVEEAKKYGVVPDDYPGHYFAITDDAFFCNKVKAAGYKVMAHGGVLGLHWDNKGTAYALPSDSYPVKTEVERRWPDTDPTNEKEYIKRVFAVYKDYYGATDIIPTEDVVLEVLEK